MRKQEMLPLKDEEIESYSNKKFCYICKKKFRDNNKDYDSDDGNDIATMMRNLMSDSFMVMLQDLIMFIVTRSLR